MKRTVRGKDESELLIRRLKDYGASDLYPLHMPGHKRLKNSCEGMDFPNPFLIDITEVEGFDNLHHPEGILKESMEWAARCYGADQTFYLINGSSSGIMAAVCGCVPHGGKLLMSRNCHKSVYHGAYVQRLRTVYVYPQSPAGLGIQGGILPSDVDKELKKPENGDIRAVLVVSPTYDGIVSDIRGIAEAAHRAGVPLIVDEAHGAHFRYGEMFPVSALELGADVVIHSVHKTMPSLTQTALLHIRNNRPDGGCYGDPEAIRRYLSIFQSTSPSYVMMASIENSIFRMEQMGDQISRYGDILRKVRKELASMEVLRLVSRKLKGTAGIWDVDESKIVVSTREAGISGEELGQILRQEYHLEMEMCGADYVTAITAPMDSEEGMLRLLRAYREVDERLGEGSVSDQSECVYSRSGKAKMTLSEAMDRPLRRVELELAEGEISGEFVYIYPPGIPVLAPGEEVLRETIEIIRSYQKKGLPVQGPADHSIRTLGVV